MNRENVGEDVPARLAETTVTGDPAVSEAVVESRLRAVGLPEPSESEGLTLPPSSSPAAASAVVAVTPLSARLLEWSDNGDGLGFCC